MPSPNQLQILTLIVPVCLLLVGIYRPILAVIGYMILVYCKTSHYYPVIAQMRGELVFAILILMRLYFSANSFTKLSAASDNINRYIFYLIISIALSFIIAMDHQYSWDYAVYHFIKTFLLYVMIVSAIDNTRDLKLFVWGFIGMFLYLAYEPVYGFLLGTGGSQQMYGINYQSEIGILAGHVALANNMNQMIPLVWFLFFVAKKKWVKIFLLGALSCFVVALVGSGSRGGIVGLIVVGACLIYFSRQRLKMFFAVGVVVLVLGVTIGSSVLHVAGRIDSDSTRGRLIGLTHGIGMLQRGNILGVGPGCFLIARQKYFSWYMESHNIYGQIIGDLGIPGILITFLFVREMFLRINIIKQRLMVMNKEQDFIFYLMLGIQTSLIIRLVISMASHGLYYFYWYVMAALIVVSNYVVMNEYKQIDTTGTVVQ